VFSGQGGDGLCGNVTNMPSRPPAALLRTPAEMAEYARRINRAVRAEVPAYAAIRDPAVARDFSAVNRKNVELYFRVLAEDRVPRAEELAELEQAARRRLHQAIPLEAMFHSYHVGVRVMWACLLERSEGLDLGHLAILTLAYAERVAQAAARAYLQERERVSRSQQEATRLFFTRLFSGDFSDEAAALREALLLGYDLSHTHVVALITATVPRGTASAELDLTLAEVRDQLERLFPESPTVLMRAGLLLAVPGDAVPRIVASLAAAMAQPEWAGRKLIVGIGTPRAGLRGLIASFNEARRAQALGTLLDPAQPIYRYDELRLFDLFKEGEPVEAFVTEVLGRLLGQDAERGTRYLETLEALFAAALNRKVAARRLGVHPNTLSYRLNRIEALLGGSLLSGEFCFRVQLALKLAQLTGLAAGRRGDGAPPPARRPSAPRPRDHAADPGGAATQRARVRSDGPAEPATERAGRAATGRTWSRP
jgi:sugar diacid utilization regulator